MLNMYYKCVVLVVHVVCKCVVCKTCGVKCMGVYCVFDVSVGTFCVVCDVRICMCICVSVCVCVCAHHFNGCLFKPGNQLISVCLGLP